MDDFQVENCYSLSLGSDTTVCSDQTVTLDPGSGYSSYLWNDNSINQTLTAYSAGGLDTTIMYYVQVINSSSCILNSDTISVSFEICDGIADPNNKDDFTIFWDQSSMSLFVHAAGRRDKPVCVIHEITGKEIFRTELNGRDQRLFLPDLPAGVYISTISENREVIYSGKIMIE
jgi:hypothetical protein